MACFVTGLALSPFSGQSLKLDQCSLLQKSRSTKFAQRQLFPNYNHQKNGLGFRNIRMQAEAAAISDTKPRFEIHPSKELAVGDTLRVTYTPAQSWIESTQPSTLLMLAMCFNDADWEKEKPVLFPLTETGTGDYRVSVNVPDFAKSLEFAFTDGGFRWDTNEDQYYRVNIKYQQKLNKDGEIETVIVGEGDEEGDDTIKRDLSAEDKFQPILKPNEEASLHRIRAEASVIGEKEGLGNIQVSLARDAFERYDDDRDGVIALKDLKQVLADIEFADLDQDRYDELVRTFVDENPTEETRVSMTAYMLMYSALEKDDEGIDIV